MNISQVEVILNKLMSTGADFGEIFEESTTNKRYSYVNSKLDKISFNYVKGLGFRIVDVKDTYYGYTNHFDDISINNITDNLISNINKKVIFDNIKLDPLKKYSSKIEISHNKYSEESKKAYMKHLDELIRSKSSLISQVSITLLETDQNVKIANHTGLYVTEDRAYTRLYISIVVSNKGKTASETFSVANSGGYELIDGKYFEEELTDSVNTAIDKLYANYCDGRVMPVVIGPGFGAVIFHEACGHAMEAASVSDNLSVLSDKLGEKIATEKVTIVDDGTLENYWGSTNIDDEGNSTRRNVLIENGVLKSYLIDEINGRKMNMQETGSSRRENYCFAPTARMNNTYLMPGNDKIEDMIKSIDYGLYAKTMGGGSVDPVTGDFNFSVNSGYMIRNGKIAEAVKSASLIGNTLEILNTITMVSNDLKYDAGVCGASSGNVPVTIGEPTIKVSNILVGGVKND